MSYGYTFIYFERDCGLFENSLYYRQQGDSESSVKKKMIFQDLTPNPRTRRGAEPKVKIRLEAEAVIGGVTLLGKDLRRVCMRI